MPLFTEVHPTDVGPNQAIAIAREWACCNATVAQARQAAIEAHTAVLESSSSATIEVVRATGHVVATAHVVDNERGALACAIWAVMKSANKID